MRLVLIHLLLYFDDIPLTCVFGVAFVRNWLFLLRGHDSRLRFSIQ